MLDVAWGIREWLLVTVSATGPAPSNIMEVVSKRWVLQE